MELTAKHINDTGLTKHTDGQGPGMPYFLIHTELLFVDY